MARFTVRLNRLTSVLQPLNRGLVHDVSMSERVDRVRVSPSEWIGMVASVGTLIGIYIYGMIIPYLDGYYRFFFIGPDDVGVTPSSILSHSRATSALALVAGTLTIGYLIGRRGRRIRTIASWKTLAVVALLAAWSCVAAIGVGWERSVGRVGLGVVLATLAALIASRVRLYPRYGVMALVSLVCTTYILQPSIRGAGIHDAFVVVLTRSDDLPDLSYWARVAGLETPSIGVQFETADSSKSINHKWFRIIATLDGRFIVINLNDCDIQSIPSAGIVITNTRVPEKINRPCFFGIPAEGRPGV